MYLLWKGKTSAVKTLRAGGVGGPLSRAAWLDLGHQRRPLFIRLLRMGKATVHRGAAYRQVRRKNFKIPVSHPSQPVSRPPTQEVRLSLTNPCPPVLGLTGEETRVFPHVSLSREEGVRIYSREDPPASRKNVYRHSSGCLAQWGRLQKGACAASNIQ